MSPQSPRLALIGGHSILGHEPAEGLGRERVATEHGAVDVLAGDAYVLLQRHGLEGYRTAAAIEHRANIAALRALGCDRALAIGSVGGLREELGVGTFIAPDDFIALQLGLSFSDGHEGERVPGFDHTWRQRVLDVWARLVPEVEVRDGGVYWQAIGPRFETPAEIGLIARDADVIGMTIASESVLAGELGISYAAVCVVDNLANGVGGAALAVEDFEAGKATNRQKLLEALALITPELCGR